MEAKRPDFSAAEVIAASFFGEAKMPSNIVALPFSITGDVGLGSTLGASFLLCNKCVRIGDPGEAGVVEVTVVVETGCGDEVNCCNRCCEGCCGWILLF